MQGLERGKQYELINPLCTGYGKQNKRPQLGGMPARSYIYYSTQDMNVKNWSDHFTFLIPLILLVREKADLLFFN